MYINTNHQPGQFLYIISFDIDKQCSELLFFPSGQWTEAQNDILPKLSQLVEELCFNPNLLGWKVHFYFTLSHSILNKSFMNLFI